MARRRKSKSFKITRPGALNRAVKGKASRNIGAVRRLARSGTPLQRKQARFYLNVLRPANAKRRKRR